MKKPLAQIIPLLARGLAPTAAVASSLLSPAAMGASGDLDPSFADVGRMTDLILTGPAWSLEPLEDDGMLFAGGAACDYYCGYYYDFAYNFVGRLSGAGSVDLGFTAAQLSDVEVLDVVLQPDGKVIGVGRTVENNRDLSSSTIFRLEPDGALDLTFGDNGIVRWESGTSSTAGAVALDPDGRIVVAGSHGRRLIVRRLFPDGTPDDSFGSAGEFQGPTNPFQQRIHVLRTGDGGYRVTANSSTSCSVVALTASGELDATFGTGGIAAIGADASTRCNSMAAQPDGRLLLAGDAGDRGFVSRLLASGEPDPSFSADILPDMMSDATAVAVGPDESIVVAGRGDFGVPGAVVVRLQADGELDVLFGQAGSTWIDLPAESDPYPALHDMTVLADQRIVAAGGYSGNRLPFVIRLLGETGGDAPGVISIMNSYQSVAEEVQQAVVTLRRSGGTTGEVSVDYQTASNDWDTATAGVDYTQLAGRLTWEDGDLTERQIIVPIASNDGPEATEWFKLVLDNTQGGAGLGTRAARIELVSDEPPPPPPPGGTGVRPPRSGGGALGFLSLLLLGVIRCLQWSMNGGSFRLRGARP